MRLRPVSVIGLGLIAITLAGACGGDPPADPDASVDPLDAPGRDAPGSDAPAGDAPRPDGSPRAPDPCPPIDVAHGSSIDGYASDVYTWRDARCEIRSAAMVRNDADDPAGHSGGYLRRITYVLGDGTTRTVDGSSDRHPGFGYTVNHFGSTSSASRDSRGTYRTVLEGRHHAIHEYHWDAVPIDGADVEVTIRWTFATGRDHPLWAITFDLDEVPADSVEADTRSPYGDLQWDGGEGVDVDGVGWGDHHRFRSLGSPVTLMNGRDYTQPNTIPHVIEWSVAADAEMGLVQTQTWMQHDAGGYWFYDRWGTRDDDGPMPEDWNWTYQLNQYEIPFLLSSKRMAWGSNYGAVGQRMYDAYGGDRQLVGWPYQSYAVFVVLDRHALAPVDAQVAWMESVESVSLGGTDVIETGAAGVGRSDTITYEPRGWDPIHAAWSLRATAGAASATIDTGTATLARPTFRVEGWTAATATVSLDGRALIADAEVFVTVDAASSTLWATLAGEITGTASLAIAP